MASTTVLSADAPATESLETEVARLRARVRALERAVNHDQVHRVEQFAAAMGGWFWEMDAALRFTYFSPSVERVTGVPPEWHYGKTREDLGIRDVVSVEQWSQHLEVLARREPFRDFLFKRRGPDGLKWMKTSGVPVFGADGSFLGYRGTATDVTAEITARHTARRLLAAVENLDELFALWDADDRLVMCNARFLEINARVVDTLEPGTSFEAHLRAAADAGLYPQAAGHEDEWIEDRLARHRAPGTPFETQRQDGRWLLICEHRLEDGSTATTCTDITEQKRVSEAVARERDLLHKVISHSPVILWSADQDGVIEVSEGLGLEAQGFRSGELVGRSLFEVYSDHPDFLDNVRRAFAGEAFSARNETAGGVYERWFEPTRDADGAVVGVVGVSVDITERTRSERIVAEQHRLLQAVLQTMPDGVQVLDRELRLAAWNERLWEVMELDGEAILAAPDPGRAFRHALASRGEYGAGDVDALIAAREAIARTPEPVRYERQLVSGKWMECRGAPVPGVGYLAIYRDIDQRKRMEVELERLATRDDLTGLVNRRSLLAALEAALSRKRRYGTAVSLMLVDIDHFKRVNDTHGHAAGDLVLRRTSEVMDAALRETDVLGRLGGEEFGAVLPDVNGDAAAHAAERVREAVSDLVVEWESERLSPTISVGVVEADETSAAEGLLARADAALYEAKGTGRNRVVAR